MKLSSSRILIHFQPLRRLLFYIGVTFSFAVAFVGDAACLHKRSEIEGHLESRDVIK